MRTSVCTLALAMVVASAWAGVAAGQAPDGRPAYREGEVLVKFKRGLNGADVSAAIGGHRLRTLRTFRGLTQRHGQTFVHLKADGRTTAELLKILENDPRVETVAPNHLRYLTPAWYPDDTYFPDQWYLHNTGQVVNATTGLSDCDVDAPEAWRMLGTPTNEVVVGVVDSGIYYPHQELASAMWINTGENPANSLDDDGNQYTNDVYGYDFAGDYDQNLFVLYPPDPFPLDVEDSSHGTHVAGTIAAVANNGRGVAGVCAAKVMALKVVAVSGGSIDGRMLLPGLLPGRRASTVVAAGLGFRT